MVSKMRKIRCNPDLVTVRYRWIPRGRHRQHGASNKPQRRASSERNFENHTVTCDWQVAVLIIDPRSRPLKHHRHPLRQPTSGTGIPSNPGLRTTSRNPTLCDIRSYQFRVFCSYPRALVPESDRNARELDLEKRWRTVYSYAHCCARQMHIQIW